MGCDIARKDNANPTVQALSIEKKMERSHSRKITPKDASDVLKDRKKFKEFTENIFDLVAFHSTGSIDKSELKSLMVQVRRRNGERLPTEKEVGDVMNDLDVDGDGKIERQEFQALIRQVLE